MGLWQDVQFATRLLVKDKWFTLVATLALAFGIGVNATVFTFVNAVLLRGLPFRTRTASWRSAPLATGAQPQHGRVVSRLQGLERGDRDVYAVWRAPTGGDDERQRRGAAPERYCGAFISAARVQAGAVRRRSSAAISCPRTIGQAPTAVVMLGNSVWQNRYGGEPGVIGRTIRINEIPAIVIGVMPDGFKFPAERRSVAAADARCRTGHATAQRAQLRRSSAGCRRRSLEQAQAELLDDQRTTRHATIPTPTRTSQATLQTVQRARQRRPDPLRVPVADGRRGVRAADRLRQRRQPAARSRRQSRPRDLRSRLAGRLARAASCVSCSSRACCWRSLPALSASRSSAVGIRLFDIATVEDVGRPYWIHFTMDFRVFAYFAARSASSPPSSSASHRRCTSPRTDVNEVLKEGGRSGSAGMRVRRWAGALVVAELALTLVLLAGAGFMMRNFMTMYRLDIGVRDRRGC